MQPVVYARGPSTDMRLAPDMAVIDPIEDMGPPPVHSMDHHVTLDSMRVRATQAFSAYTFPVSGPMSVPAKRETDVNRGWKARARRRGLIAISREVRRSALSMGILKKARIAWMKTRFLSPVLRGSFAITASARSHVFRVPKMSVQMRAVVRTFLSARAYLQDCAGRGIVIGLPAKGVKPTRSVVMQSEATACLWARVHPSKAAGTWIKHRVQTCRPAETTALRVLFVSDLQAVRSSVSACAIRVSTKHPVRAPWPVKKGCKRSMVGCAATDYVSRTSRAHRV